MIISPPFLPARGATQAEDAWLDSAMSQPPSRLPSTEALEGSFPLSYSLAWHNGIHIQAPQADGAVLPVRAIADGTVLFVQEPPAPNTSPYDGQNYNPFDRAGAKTAAWTDNGCVVVKHTTEIGAEGTTPTELVYYSLYMHLSEIARIVPAKGQAKRPLKTGDAIWRKDEIGKPGQIYGDRGQIHFEISLNAANLEKLIKRKPDWIEPATLPAPTTDGRIDSIFGSLYFYLPASTPTDTGTTLPKNHLRGAGGGTLGTPVWIQLSYDKGDAALQTFNERGAPIGGSQPEAEAEYKLYSEANSRHISLSATDKAHSSPSGWYELLRFGRNIGRGPAATDKDPLPANAAHWRRITSPTGQAVWADLNASGSFKFSDADFLPVMGWNCISDDKKSDDQRCDSVHLKNLIRDPDVNNKNRMESAELIKRLGKPEVQKQLRRTLCKFPSEWDKATVEARYGFVKELESFKQSADAWPRLKTHLEAVSFNGLPQEFKDADWRVHPREFVGMMRQCGWLSAKELARCLPRKSLSDPNLTWATAFARASVHVVYINNYFRKYKGAARSRHAHALAQIYIETGLLRTITEDGSGNGHLYGPFYGRGYNQLTWAGNYEIYGVFKSLANKNNPSYVDARITGVSKHVRDSGGALIQWFPRFDPQIVGADLWHAADASGLYWVSKSFRGKKNMNRVCDLPFDAISVAFNCWLINGGGAGYANRQQFAQFLHDMLFDETPKIDSVQFSYPPLTPSGNPTLCKTFPPTLILMSIKSTVHYDKQIP